MMDVYGGDNWSYMTCVAWLTCEACDRQYQQTNTQLIQAGWMSFLSPNQQCQSTEGK